MIVAITRWILVRIVMAPLVVVQPMKTVIPSPVSVKLSLIYLSAETTPVKAQKTVSIAQPTAVNVLAWVVTVAQVSSAAPTIPVLQNVLEATAIHLV